MMKYRPITLVILCICLVTGCAKKTAKDEVVIATVSSKPITMADFNRKVAKLPPYYKTIVGKNRKLYLDDMIMEQLFYEEAVRKGINQDNEVVDLVNEAKRKIVISKYIQTEVDEQIKVSDLEMKEFYDSHRDDFQTPALWRASHILVTNEEEARKLRDEILAGAPFEELARAHSIDATASRGGDIGYFRRGQLVPEFEKACMKLEKDGVSDVVRTQFGYHIIKLTDKRDPVPEEFEKVRAMIEGEIRKKKREEAMSELVADLRNRYNVIVKEDVFGREEEKGAR